METKEINGYKITVDNDECPDNPRSWDNLGTMVCFHNRYNLGDTHEYRSDDFNSWEEMKEDIIDNENVLVILPLYLYDHSGITMKTSPFSCPWDSGQVGWIFVSKKKVMDEFHVDFITPELKERVKSILEGEVETYDQYLTGEVYYHKVEKDGEILDSCHGFYSFDECMTDAEDVVEYYNTERNICIVD